MSGHDEDDVARVMARNAEILECKRQIQFWTERLAHLQTTRRRERLLASFDLDPRGTWSELTAYEQQDRDWFIKGISNGVFGPDPWRRSWYGDLPEQFREDRDVVLAFVARDDFEHDFMSYLTVFEVPESLRDDKEVMLAVCAKNSQALRLASPRLQDDPDVVSTALGGDDHWAQYQLQHASDRLRSDRDFILRQVQRTCEELHRCGFGWIKHAQLRCEDEKRVALAVLKRMSELKSSGHKCIFSNLGIIQYFSAALRDDWDVMLRFVEDNWQNLEACSDRLKDSEEFKNVAVTHDANALTYCLEATKEEFFSKRDKNDVLKDLEVGDLIFESLPNKMKTDPAILLAAFKGGFICFKDLPDDLQQEKSFVLALPEDPQESFYDYLPEELQNDEELCLELLKKKYGWPETVLGKVPSLYRSREAIIAAIKVCPDIIQNCSFRDDEEVVLLACKNDIKCLEYASERLKSDRGFIQTVLSRSSHSAVILYVSHDFQVNNTDIVLDAIECGVNNYPSVRPDDLAPELWQNRSIILAWLKKGWSLLVKIDRESPLLDDAELVRLAVEKCGVLELLYASSSLKGSREFVLSVVKTNGLSLSYVDAAFKRDDEIVTEAIANTPNTILHCFRWENEFSYLVSLAARVRSRLELHKSFFDVFLRGISVSRPHVAPAKRCRLSILDRGSETSTAFKKLIAEYLGVPMNTELRSLRTTSENLRKLRY